MDPKQLIEERQITHGDTWKLMGSVIDALLPQIIDMIQKHPKYVWSWLMIASKLVRALFSPTSLEHWNDIQGYAQLVINDLQGGSK